MPRDPMSDLPAQPFVPLGHDHGRFWFLNCGGQVLEFSAKALGRESTLWMLAPPSWWEANCKGRTKAETRLQAMSDLIHTCYAVGIYDPERLAERSVLNDVNTIKPRIRSTEAEAVLPATPIAESRDIHPVDAMFDLGAGASRRAFLRDVGPECPHLIRISQAKEDPGHIYFIRAPELKRIKVGFTRDVERRFASLQNGSPCALELLGSARGVPAVETALHSYLAKYKAYGEWFGASLLVWETTFRALRLDTGRVSAEGVDTDGINFPIVGVSHATGLGG